MIYPEFLCEGNTVGICAPSAGVGDKITSFEHSEERFRERGWKVRETAHVRLSSQRGGTAEERGSEVTELFEDEKTDAVLSAAGGDFLYEVLPYIDWDAIRNHPKWMAGASDPTSILYTITTKLDIATIYGFNAGSFDAEELSPYEVAALDFLEGKLPVQHSSEMHAEIADFLPEYNGCDTPTIWYANRNSIQTSGRCIGGCIDVLKDLIGTRYDGTREFIRRYADDGIIWYFDDFSLSAEAFYRTLLQMRYAGWFEHTRAILIGRVLFKSSETGMSYEEAIDRALCDIPTIREADIGHTVPGFTMINGAVMNLDYAEGKGTISFQLH